MRALYPDTVNNPTCREYIIYRAVSTDRDYIVNWAVSTDRDYIIYRAVRQRL